MEKDIQKSLVREFVLEGLHCAGCAAKIERKVNSLEEVEEAVLNFATSTLSVELTNEKSLDGIEDKVRKIVNSYEPHVGVREKNLKNTINFTDNKCCCCEGHDDHCSKKNHNHSSEQQHEHNRKSSYEHRSEGANAHSHEHDGELNNTDMIKVLIGVMIFAIVSILKFSYYLEVTMYVLSYLFIGGDVVLTAVRNITRGEVFDENFLMVIATIGAFAIGELPEAVFVMLFYKVGEAFQDRAVNNSRRSIKQLMNIKPEMARIKDGYELKEVSPEGVQVGDIILVKPGEKVPLDGTILEGNSMVNTSDLTGESLPRSVKEGQEVLSGFINVTGVLTIRVNKVFSESAVSKILDLVENAGAKKAPTEQFITKFARYYTPIVVFSALALAVIPPIIMPDANFSQWLKRALIFLVVSCPCALVISVPLGFFAGIGNASKKGILIKGGNYLEALNDVDTMVFDKTGTLTEGIFEVNSVSAKISGNENKIIELAAYGEVYSNHPIAKSIIRYYSKDIDKTLIENYQEISGHGIKVNINGKEILIGNEKLMEVKGIKYNKASEVGTVVYVAEDNKFLGHIVIADRIKKDADLAISKLKNKGIKTVMLTGDNKDVAESIGAKLGIDEVYSQLLPKDKVDIFEKIKEGRKGKKKVAFAGDGVNDAPVLTTADVGVAMGALGADAAIEAADIVLMTDEPSQIVTALNISQFTRNVVVQNIVFALGVKLVVLLLGALGMANMWEAVFADVGVALIAILNSMRILKFK